MLQRHLLTADVIYNGMGTPRASGAVVVQEGNEGAQIVAAEDAVTARQNFPDAGERHVGFAISPPLVNAHTHLDLSYMPYTPGSYDAFIAKVIRYGPERRARGLEAAEAGLKEIRSSGVTTIGDVVTSEAVMELLLRAPDLRGVAYWEVFGPDPKDADRIFGETVEKLRKFRAWERPGGVKLGLSPHTPHTVSAPLLQKLAGLARSSDLPLQIHVAESEGEIALHKDGTGPLRERMRGVLPHWRPSGLTPVQYLKDLGVLDAQPTLIHMVHVSEEDVREVQRAGCVVVHCPRSNIALECGRFPWEMYMKHGVEVAFGTDSKGSSPSLSVQQEVMAARALHGDKASDLALVRAAVKGGYRALSLTPPRFTRGDDAAGVYIWKGSNEFRAMSNE